MDLNDLKDISIISASIFSIIGGSIAVPKTLYEIAKLREEKSRERKSRIHAKQIDAIVPLYIALEKCFHYYQQMTKPYIFEGEKTEEYPALLSSALSESRKQFMLSRLFLPPDVEETVDAFVNKIIEGQVFLEEFKRLDKLNKHQDPRYMKFDAENYWNKAENVSFTDLPPILQALKRRAREIIHDELG